MTSFFMPDRADPAYCGTRSYFDCEQDRRSGLCGNQAAIDLMAADRRDL